MKTVCKSILCFFFLAANSIAQHATIDPMVEQEVSALAAKVPEFEILKLPGTTGSRTFTKNQSLTIEKLRGVRIDNDPPRSGKAADYKKTMVDSYKAGTAPYVAKGILPFRLNHFNCEFSYGGWHNYLMQDYAVTHGFKIVYPYVRDNRQQLHFPDGTEILHWTSFVDWKKWFAEHGLTWGRFDLLHDLDLQAMLLEEGRIEDQSGEDYLMLDMEHVVLAPAKLRKQKWYPSSGTSNDRAEFEKRYYDGYAKTYTSVVQAARSKGWKNISVYGWAPYGRTWGGLEKPNVDEGVNHAWSRFGKTIYDSVDIVNNSVYCFYWTPKNVAYTLANIDENLRRVRSMNVQKPVRPYFWPLLHGGGGGWRWWKGQPLPNEEQLAMTAMAFFTGVDGIVIWNWSGTTNHHLPAVPDLAGSSSDNPTVMVRIPFRLPAQPATGDGPDFEAFNYLDALHILDYDRKSDIIRFQKIRPNERNHGVAKPLPIYNAKSDQLQEYLRPKSESVAAVFEALALIKPLEYTLRTGTPKIDVDAKRKRL